MIPYNSDEKIYSRQEIESSELLSENDLFLYMNNLSKMVNEKGPYFVVRGRVISGDISVAGIFAGHNDDAECPLTGIYMEKCYVGKIKLITERIGYDSIRVSMRFTGVVTTLQNGIHQCFKHGENEVLFTIPYNTPKNKVVITRLYERGFFAIPEALYNDHVNKFNLYYELTKQIFF